jgi:hypothetical protein
MSVPTNVMGVEQPYPGLRPFERGERQIFFGRDEQLDELLERLATSRFLAVVGVSGCGKSSLVRAGLIDALEAGYLPSAGARWRVATMRPRNRPFRKLAEALIADRVLPGEGNPEAVAFLRATLRRGPLGIVDALRESPLEPEENLLLVVDQFEEIFQFREGDRDEADAFVALLLATAKQEDLPVYIVLTMRSDYLGDCAVFAGLPEALNGHQFLTPRLTREQRREAIEGPAQVFNAHVEIRLVTRLLNDMGADPDQLPLMQHVLRCVWARAVAAPHEDSEVVLKLQDYEAVGTIDEALSRHATAAYSNLPDSDQRIARILFRALSEPTSRRRDIRRRATLGEVAAVAEVSLEDVRRVVEVFSDPELGLLTPVKGANLEAGTMLEISHEIAFREWGFLDQLAKTELKSYETYLTFLSKARRMKKGDASDLYLRGEDLHEAFTWQQDECTNRAWAERYDPDLALVETFIAASTDMARREASARRGFRLLKRLVLVAAGLLAVVVPLLIWALFERGSATRAATDAKEQRDKAEKAATEAQEQRDLNTLRADTNRSLRLSMQARDATYTSPQRAVLLALEASQAAKDSLRSAAAQRNAEDSQAARRQAQEAGHRAEEAVRNALARCGGRALGGHQWPVINMAVSPDGRLLATADGGPKGVVGIWDLTAPDPAEKPLHLLAQDGPTPIIAFVNDRRFVAAGATEA